MRKILVPGYSPKIQFGYQYAVDFLHPISYGLKYVNVTNSLNSFPTFSRGTIGSYTNTSNLIKTVQSAGGAGIACPGGSLAARLKWTGCPTVNQNGGTILCYTRIGFPNNDGIYKFLFRLDDGTQTNSIICLQRADAQAFYIGWYPPAISSAPTPATNSKIPAITGITWQATGGSQFLWLEGKKYSAGAVPTTYDTSAWQLNIGNAVAGIQDLSWFSVNDGTTIYWMAIWDRVLSDSEIYYLNVNPMCFLTPLEPEMQILSTALAPPAAVLYGHNIGANFNRRITTIGY